MADKPRVVITGVGAVAPNGIGKDAYWEGLLKGHSGIRRINRFDASKFPCQIAGEIHDFQAAAYIDPHEVKRLSRVSQLALVAAKMAWMTQPCRSLERMPVEWGCVSAPPRAS